MYKIHHRPSTTKSHCGCQIMVRSGFHVSFEFLLWVFRYQELLQRKTYKQNLLRTQPAQDIVWDQAQGLAQRREKQFTALVKNL